MRNEESTCMDDSQSSALPVVSNVITAGRNMDVDQHSIDAEEEEKVMQFHSNGCGCSNKCSTQFTLEHIREMRADMAQLERTALDMTIMGQVNGIHQLQSIHPPFIQALSHAKGERKEIHQFVLPPGSSSVQENISISAQRGLFKIQGH